MHGPRAPPAGGTPTPFDRLLATRFGVRAVECVADDKFGQMVALRGTTVVAVSLKEAVAEPKRVPPDGELVRAARALRISMGDVP